jgi:MOSC domain-containing protein YiiM
MRRHAVRAFVRSINLGGRKGAAKLPVPEGELRSGHGLVGDAHANSGARQVSVLARESIQKQRQLSARTSRPRRGPLCPKGPWRPVPGGFAENITTQGIRIHALAVGTRLRIGERVLLEITWIGRDCHTRCPVYRRFGDCVVPHQSVFARVLEGGTVRPGDPVAVFEAVVPER